MKVIRVISAVYEPDDAIVFQLEIDEGEGLEVIPYAYRATDPYMGDAGDFLTEWIAEHGEEIAPYVVPAPPTAEELRARMQPISPRQLRLALVRSGISLTSLEAALDALPAGQAKEEAEIEWEYATEYKRLAPALLVIAEAVGLTPEQVDAMWAVALAI